MSSLNLGQLTTAFYGLQGILGAAASSGSGGGQVQATTVEARPASSVVISRPGKPATVTTTPVVSTPPPAAYEQRLKELVNTTYGPTAYDDYIYGVDYEKFRKEIKRTMAAAGGKEFDSTDFYLGAMNRLYRQGF